MSRSFSTLSRSLARAGLCLCLGWMSSPAGAEDGIRLNSATAQELSEVDGVDEAMAMRIVEYRNERGGISSVEQAGRDSTQLLSACEPIHETLVRSAQVLCAD